MTFLLKPPRAEGFVTIPSVFRPDECRTIIEMFVNPIDGVVGNNNTDKTIRDSKIRWLSPSKETQWIFDRVCSVVNTANDQWFGFDLSEMEDIQLTEYDAVYEGFY